MKKVVITGANGFVGSAVCKELSKHGMEIIAIVRHPEESISHIENLEGIRVVYADISEFRYLEDVILDRDVDVLYHFAWMGSAGPQRGDVDTQLKNIQYTCDTVKACANIGCGRFVFASSIMEYEISAIMGTNMTPEINTLYSSAKVAADYMARTIAGASGIDYIRTVISNIYGPGESSPRLINTSLRKMLKGEHCSFSSGEQIYDFIYITDAARALYEVAQKGEKNKTYYIGSQNPRPLKEFLLKMRDCIDSRINIGLCELPSKEISLSYKEFDIDAVKNDTGFVPIVDFDEGIRNTIAWLKGEN